MLPEGKVFRYTVWQRRTRRKSRRKACNLYQSISFDGEERQRLARQDREIYLPGIETRRANAMPNSIPISNRHCRFVDRSFFKCGSLYKGWQPALVSVVAENRKPCPPTKKKTTTSNQIEEKLEQEFPMCPQTIIKNIHGPSER